MEVSRSWLAPEATLRQVSLDYTYIYTSLLPHADISQVVWFVLRSDVRSRTNR